MAVSPGPVARARSRTKQDTASLWPMRSNRETLPGSEPRVSSNRSGEARCRRRHPTRRRTSFRSGWTAARTTRRTSFPPASSRRRHFDRSESFSPSRAGRPLSKPCRTVSMRGWGTNRQGTPRPSSRSSIWTCKDGAVSFSTRMESSPGAGEAPGLTWASLMQKQSSTGPPEESSHKPVRCAGSAVPSTMPTPPLGSIPIKAILGKTTRQGGQESISLRGPPIDVEPDEQCAQEEELQHGEDSIHGDESTVRRSAPGGVVTCLQAGLKQYHPIRSKERPIA